MSEEEQIDLLEARDFFNTKDNYEGNLSKGDQAKLLARRLMEKRAETEQYLERSIALNESPVGVIQLNLGENRCSIEDVGRAVKLRNRLIGVNNEGNSQSERNAIVNIHREAKTLHISFSLLNEDGLNTYHQILDELKEESADATTALGIPEKGDEQFVVFESDHFTIYGSGVLAMARGHKVKVGEDVPVHQLQKHNSTSSEIRDKETPVGITETDFQNFRWSNQAQIEKIPDKFFDYIDPNSIDEIKIDPEDFIFIKLDVNDSGKRLMANELHPDERKKTYISRRNRILNVTSDFRHLIVSAEEINIRLKAAGLKSYTTAVLGDSLILILPRKERELTNEDGESITMDGLSVFESVIQRNFVDSKPATFLTPKFKDNAGRGHISAIELPFKDEADNESKEVESGSEDNKVNKITLFTADNKILAIDRFWSKEEERASEKFHKLRRLPVNKIVRYQDLEEL